MEKISISALVFVLSSSVFAGECRMVARDVTGDISTRSGIEKVSSLRKCVGHGSILANGWAKAMIQYVDNQGGISVIELTPNTPEAFYEFYRSGNE
jgi:hypothetical protein